MQVGDRDLFLQLVATALQGEREIGDGSLHQVVRSIQRDFLRSRPVLSDEQTRAQSRYSRRGEFTRRRASAR